MLIERLRSDVAAAARRLVQDRLVVGTSGNVSARDPETGYLAMTPSGLPYDSMDAADVVVLDLDGNVIDGHWEPTSEHQLHRAVYRSDDRRGGIVHTHSMFATVFAACRREIPAVHYVIAGLAPTIRVAPYATYGTAELAQNAIETMGADNAVLLENHGVLATGSSLARAYSAAQTVEYLAELYYRALQLGEPRILPADEVLRVRERFATYGQAVSTSRTPAT